MPRTLGLSSPIYEIPFDDHTLLVVGRLALMWGQIIFHLESVLKLLLKQDDEQANDYERVSVARKLRDLNRELSMPENAPHRTLLLRVRDTINAVQADRNVVFHGLWGRHWAREQEGWRAAARSHSRREPFYADDLKALHERMVEAAVALDDAWYGLGIAHGPQPGHRNRQQLWVPMEMELPKPYPEIRPKFRR